MDFSLSAEQELLKKEVQRFLKNECPKELIRELEAGDLGYSPEIWKKTAELGWQGLIIPEAYGGEGGDLLDLAVLFEEIGRATFLSPMFSTLLFGVVPLLDLGNEDQKSRLLQKVAGGEIILTMAFSEPETDCRPEFMATKAVKENGGFSIKGTKLFVQNAHIADQALVVAATGEVNAEGKGISIFLVEKDLPGLNLVPLITVAGDSQFEMGLNGVHVPADAVLGEIDAGWPVVDATLLKATAIQCVEAVGVMQEALAMTADYTSKRVQFGRPIGSFQAVQHRLADMFTDVEGARWISYQAVYRINQGLPAAREVAIAKAWTSDACQRVAYGAQHLHGGIGMDMEYDLNFYFRWAKAMALNLGAAPFHLSSIEPVMREP
jgi:alkylation response protein AidB-like acyl-CoA dehydrogenase